MTARPVQFIPAYTAASLTVVNGANLGDEIGLADDVQHDDIYHFSPDCARRRLALISRDDNSFEIATDSDIAKPGHRLHLDACVTFMAPDGSTVDCVIAVEVDHDGMIEAILPIPLNSLTPKTDYRIIRIDRNEARRKIAQIGCVSFTAGTKITMFNGEQRAVEDLKEGDKVLTRDSGPKEIRWIGRNTMKAVGAFAPILIKAGTLNNLDDLSVSPDHRLFIYQREDTLGAGRSEVLVRAQHLLNGTTVTRQEGGYVDYYQLIFDEHQIIFAEGIAVESLLLDEQTRPALPDNLSSTFEATLPGRDTGLRAEFELSESLARRPDAAELLRRASTR